MTDAPQRCGHEATSNFYTAFSLGCSDGRDSIASITRSDLPRLKEITASYKAPSDRWTMIVGRQESDVAASPSQNRHGCAQCTITQTGDRLTSACTFLRGIVPTVLGDSAGMMSIQSTKRPPQQHLLVALEMTGELTSFPNSALTFVVLATRLERESIKTNSSTVCTVLWLLVVAARFAADLLRLPLCGCCYL